MTLHIDREANSAYLYVADKNSELPIKTKPISDDIIFDVRAEDGRLVGIEFLDASTYFPEEQK
jgi:uncharacterized protein YuzE